MGEKRWVGGMVLGACALLAPHLRAEEGAPPWTDPDDMPLPAWARSAVPKRADVPLSQGPSALETRRGALRAGVRVPLFGARRGNGCGGRWLLVGPAAWVCSDVADLSADPPLPAGSPLPILPKAAARGLPYRYFFVRESGAEGYSDLERAEEGGPDVEREAGAALAVEDERVVDGVTWVRTHAGPWFPANVLAPARPSAFVGEVLKDGALDFAWVVADKAPVFAAPARNGKRVTTHRRLERVPWREERAVPQGGSFVRISDDGADEGLWMQARDLARPVAAPPPEGVAAGRGERWIDVDLASQTLVAYEGERPAYATLVSTGRGAEGTETATPRGVHRIWVKLVSSTMASLTADEEDGYALEDVPWVQFFDRGVALHGAFWHDQVGRVHSHGCVNLAPRDAVWLFHFTGPHLPAGWSGVLPVPAEPGTLVRVR